MGPIGGVYMGAGAGAGASVLVCACNACKSVPVQWGTTSRVQTRRPGVVGVSKHSKVKKHQPSASAVKKQGMEAGKPGDDSGTSNTTNVTKVKGPTRDSWRQARARQLGQGEESTDGG